MSSVVNHFILIIPQKLLAEGDQGDANVGISLQKYITHVEMESESVPEWWTL